MRHLIGLLLLLIIGFTSCEGRKTSTVALKESVEDFKKNVSIEVKVYEPESYMEQEVDTLLSNGFRVKIKTKSDMANSVLFTKIKDTINYQTYYRNFKFRIVVEKDGNLIFDQNFDKKQINQILDFNSKSEQGSPYRNFNSLAILKSIEVNNESVFENGVEIDIMYAIPNSNRKSNHKFQIDAFGALNVIANKVI